MRLSATRLFPLLLLLALALLSFWLERTLQEEQKPPSLRRHDPDFRVENFKLSKFNAAGALESTLAAARMAHFPDDDSTELLAPRIVHARPDELRLTLSAERGTLSPNGEEVFLNGDVQVLREAGAGQPEARMRTSFLHLVSARSLMRTDREITITEPERQLSARGMEYYNETRQLFLREQVRGRFAPKSKK